jgi:L-amino acid N-acyltransferase YncA
VSVSANPPFEPAAGHFALDLDVRLATPFDGPALAAIYGPHCTNGLASFETVAPTADEMAERVRTITTIYPWLTAVTESGEIAGYAYGSRHRERSGYRWSVDVAVYVAAHAAGRGVGRQLYGRLLPLLEAQRLHRAYAGIALPNDASVALHRRFGFEPVGLYREVGWKHGTWIDVHWWSRPLADHGGPPSEPIAFVDLPPDLITNLSGAPRE